VTRFYNALKHHIEETTYTPYDTYVEMTDADEKKSIDRRRRDANAEIKRIEIQINSTVDEAKRIEDEANQRAEEARQAEINRLEAIRVARREDERKRLAEAAARVMAEEAERKRLAEEARVKAEKDERKRLAEEAARVKAEEAERKRLAEEAERKRLAEEDERKRLAEEARVKAEKDERKRLAEEAERKRLAEEAERKRLAEEARVKAEEDERKRLAEEAELKRLAEEAELKRLAEEAARAEAEKRRLAHIRRAREKSEAAVELKRQEAEIAAIIAKQMSEQEAAEDKYIKIDAEIKRQLDKEQTKKKHVQKENKTTSYLAKYYGLLTSIDNNDGSDRKMALNMVQQYQGIKDGLSDTENHNLMWNLLANSARDYGKPGKTRSALVNELRLINYIKESVGGSKFLLKEKNADVSLGKKHVFDVSMAWHQWNELRNRLKSESQTIPLDQRLKDLMNQTGRYFGSYWNSLNK
jgi:hypothetical protein